MTHTDSSFYHVLLAPPAGTTPVNNPHNIALRLFNRDPTSSPASFQSIVFGALHCDSGLLFARTTSSLLYVGGHTTKNPGLYTSDGALLEEHLVGVTTFSLLDLYARPGLSPFCPGASSPRRATSGRRASSWLRGVGAVPPPPQRATTTP